MSDGAQAAEAADQEDGPIGEWTMQPNGNLAALFHHGLLQLILRRQKGPDGEISWRPEVHGVMNNYTGEAVTTVEEAEAGVIQLLVEVIGLMAGDAARA